jgi:hypothetical protein
MKVAEEGIRLVVGALPAGAPADVADDLPLDRVRAAQAGLLADMNEIADALYGRSAPPSTLEVRPS